MRSGLLIFFSCLVISSCKNKNHIPRDVLPVPKMQAVLWDMMRADQFLTDFVFNKDSSADKKAESIKLYRQVFSIHGITREEFQRSFAFYRDHPEWLKMVMDSMVVNKTVLTPVPEPRPDTVNLIPQKKNASPDTSSRQKKLLRVE